jgi:D-psicose/D-tagatose/L-ribulose 3-epimerase
MKIYLVFTFALFISHLASGDVRIMQNLFILDADMSHIQVSDLEKLVARGAQGFELPGTVATMEDTKRLGAYIKARGLPVGLNVAVDPQRDPSSLDQSIRWIGIDYLKSRIDFAVELGATTVAGPIALPWGGFYDTDSTVELHEHFLKPKLAVAVESMREVADYAKARGINLALEPLHRHEMHGLNTMAEAAAFVKEVGRANFGVCLDSSHEVIDGSGPVIYSQLVKDLYERGYYIYAQVSAPSRGDVKNSWIPWHDYLGLLQDIKISSVTVEIMQAKPPFTGRMGAGIRISRLPFDDPFQTVEDAITTTRQKWSECATLLALKREKR